MEELDVNDLSNLTYACCIAHTTGSNAGKRLLMKTRISDNVGHVEFIVCSHGVDIFTSNQLDIATAEYNKLTLQKI